MSEPTTPGRGLTRRRLFGLLGAIFPTAAIVPILLYIGLLIGAQALSILHPLPQTAIYIICSVLSIAAPIINLQHAFLKRI